MIKLSIIERMVISAILTLAVFISSLNICISFIFCLGSLAFQLVDYIVAYYRFKNN